MLAEIESRNTGKPLAAALNDEIPAIADVFRFFAGAARTQHGALAGEYLPAYQHDPARSRGRGRLDRALELSVDDGGMEVGTRAGRRQYGGSQALRADTADRAQARRISAEFFPHGVVNIVCGRGDKRRRAAGQPPRRAHGFAYRRCRHRPKVLAAAAGNLKRTHLELGGKAPVIVFDDADVDAVVSGVRTFGFYNAGQDCTAACRFMPARRYSTGSSPI